MGGEEDGSEVAKKRVIDLGDSAEGSDDQEIVNDLEDGCETSVAELEEVFEKPYFLVYWDDVGLIKYTIHD